MRKQKTIILLTFCITTLMLFMSSCSSRLKTPVLEEDSTIVYFSKKTDDVAARITLCRRVDKETDDRIGVGDVFSLRQNAYIRAFVDLENRYESGNKELMFHFDWIGPTGETFYLKRVYLSPQDSTSTINSSISISPEQRDEGEYKLRIYFFRELIAEKKFEILPELQLDPEEEPEIETKIALYRKKSKKNGKLIGEGTTFKIKKKEKVRALVEIDNRFAYGEQELIFNIDWIGPDGESFYHKSINLFPDDSTTTLNSSISISPGKREPGEYAFQLYLFDKLLEEKKFQLVP